MLFIPYANVPWDVRKLFLAWQVAGTDADAVSESVVCQSSGELGGDSKSGNKTGVEVWNEYRLIN